MNAILKSPTIQRSQLRKQVNTLDAHRFFNLLTSPELLDTVDEQLPEHRERLFPPTETLSIFIAQALSTDSSCQRAVNEFAIKRLTGGLSVCSTRTGAYCKARQRLPVRMVSTLVKQVGRLVDKTTPAHWRWQGRPVRLIDGTTITLPDTESNQSRFPQQGNQKPGAGFPISRIVGIICLSSGVILDAVMGPYKGKGGNEQALLRGMLDSFQTNDIVLGDSYYCTYFLITALQERGVDLLFEQHGMRKRSTDFRRGERLGPKDHLIVLQKPILKPDWMTQAQYEAAPECVTVRELKVDGKTLVTSLLSAKETPKAAVKALYKARWHIELDLRNIKTTLGMNALSCKTPEMNEKEMWVYFLAYNLIRLLMANAALLSHVLPRQLSFKHTLQLWMAWQPRYTHSGNEESIQILMVLIAQSRVGNRPGRIEPRALKRRPKPYPLLMKKRSDARDDIRIHGHPQKLK